MRVSTKKPDSIGDTRIVRKFLLLPRHFGRDWRWLEYADIVERYKYVNGFLGREVDWEEVDFADNITDKLNKQDKGTVVKVLELLSCRFYDSREALVHFRALLKDSTTTVAHAWVTILDPEIKFECQYWLDTPVIEYLDFLVYEEFKKRSPDTEGKNGTRDM